MTELWEFDQPINEYDENIDIPLWISQDISPYNVAAIIQGGCASGAYMPAVTYYKAVETMSDHGDEVLDFIHGHYGEIPQPNDCESWSGLARFYLSCAVELWATSIEEELTETLKELESVE